MIRKPHQPLSILAPASEGCPEISMKPLPLTANRTSKMGMLQTSNANNFRDITDPIAAVVKSQTN